MTGHSAELLPVVRGLVITGEQLALVRALAVSACRQRERNGLPPSRQLAALEAACAAAMTADGHSDVREHPACQVGAVDVRSTVTTRQAADKLAKSERQVRRLAQQLGGRKVGGVWHIDVDALEEHLDGLNEGAS